MSVGIVDLDVYQGEDWTTDVLWTDDSDVGMNVIHPCRMEIKGVGGQTLVTLLTNPNIPDGDVPSINVSSNIGLIQLHIAKDVTASFPPGVYSYDLFVTTNDGDSYAGPQTIALIGGKVNVNKRTTVL